MPQLSEGGIEIEVHPNGNGVEKALFGEQSGKIQQQIRVRRKSTYVLVSLTYHLSLLGHE
jgi:hypothetical protein